MHVRQLVINIRTLVGLPGLARDLKVRNLEIMNRLAKQSELPHFAYLDSSRIGG